MQAIIGTTIFVVVFWRLYKLKDFDPLSQKWRKWERTEGTIVDMFHDDGGRRYYVSFSDAQGEHLGDSFTYFGAKVLHEGDKVNILYSLYSKVQGTGVDSSVYIEGIKKEESKSKFDVFSVFLLCAIGFGILDIYFIILEIMKLIAR